MPSQLAAAIDQFRAQVLARDAEARRRILKAYSDAYARLRPMIELVQNEIALLDDVSPYRVFQLRRWQQLEQELLNEIATVGRWAEAELTDAQRDVVAMARNHTRALALVQAQNPALVGSWVDLPVLSIHDLIGFSLDGTPLAMLFDDIGPGVADFARTTMVNAIALGQHPRLVANALSDATGQAFTRTYTIARTEMLRSYRTAALRTYQENDDILDGWVWVAARSERTCAACLALDGRIFPMEEQFFKQHVNCRCSAAPSVAGVPWERETGRDWIAKQPQKVQDKILGKQGGAAYRNGDVQLDDFVREVRSDVWGNSYVDGGIGWAKKQAAS